MYHQDYGGPIGNRIVGRDPDWLEWQIVQNSNAYEEGFTETWDGIRFQLWKERTKKTEDALRPFLEIAGIKSIYLTGHRDPELISPGNWTMDNAFLDLPGRRDIQLDLLENYKTNPPLYATWQRFMRDHHPKTLIFWGQGDVFSRRRAARRTSATCPTRRCTGLKPGTSPSRATYRRSQLLSPASIATRSPPTDVRSQPPGQGPGRRAWEKWQKASILRPSDERPQLSQRSLRVRRAQRSE
jgi:hypothetical protein